MPFLALLSKFSYQSIFKLPSRIPLLGERGQLVSQNCISIFLSSITAVLTSFNLAMKYGANISPVGLG